MDPDAQLLAALSLELERDYASSTDESWAGTPFAWVRTMSSRRRGAIGEKLVAGWFAAKGANVVRSPDSEADRIIENIVHARSGSLSSN